MAGMDDTGAHEADEPSPEDGIALTTEQGRALAQVTQSQAMLV